MGGSPRPTHCRAGLGKEVAVMHGSDESVKKGKRDCDEAIFELFFFCRCAKKIRHRVDLEHRESGREFR